MQYDAPCMLLSQDTTHGTSCIFDFQDGGDGPAGVIHRSRLFCDTGKTLLVRCMNKKKKEKVDREMPVASTNYRIEV